MITILVTLVKPLRASMSVRDERGQSLVDYMLLAGLIAFACVAATSFFGGHLSGVYVP